jgi:hypothetical protein
LKELKQIAIDSIRIDGGTQMRAEIDQVTVTDYAERIEELPPSIVFDDGAAIWMGDGFHRFHAHRKAEKKKMLCEVRKGTQREAILFALGANHAHGLKRSNADKRKAVETMLNDEEWAKWSDRKIADASQVSQPFVGEIRKAHLKTFSDAQPRTTERDGKKYEMDTAGIRDSNKARAKPEDPDEFFPKRAEKNGKSEPTKPAEPVKDETGTEIKDAKIAALYVRRQEITDLMTAVSRIKSNVTKGCENKDPLLTHLNLNQFQADCGNLHRALRFARPYALCPYCGGRGCKVCKSGLVGETIYKNYTPEDLKV